MDTLLEVNENVASEIFHPPLEEGAFQEIEPKIFSLKSISEPLTVPSLNNAIYELGVVDLCWPEITDPVFETRTCFPKSYYTNSTKERLLLAYAENFRRQFLFHYKARKPLFFQAPNECGLQKMVCTSIRPTKLCYAHTNTWQGVASLVADYFNYEPLTKCMLHENVSSPDSHKVEIDLDPLDNDTSSNEETTGSGAASQIKYNGDPKIHRDNKKNSKKRILREYDHILSKVQNVAKDIHKQAERSENEFDIFGRSIAAQLKNMPLDKAVEAQMFIQNYLSNMRLKSMNNS